MFRKNGLIQIILILIVHIPLLFAQESIIDSVFSSWQLDGEIFFRESTQSFEIFNITTYMIIGDTGWGINPDPNSRSHGYISFELPEIPGGYFLDSAYVRIHQYMSYGNNEPDIFPIWDVPSGDTMFCIMDHIDYGNSLDPGDWTAGYPGDPQTLHTNIGIISDCAENGYRYLDITEFVQYDYNNSRNRSQYRIRFPIETDWDYWHDNIYIHTGEGSNVYSVIIFIAFSQQNSNMSNVLKVIIYSNSYPNPFNPVTTIEYQISKPSYVRLQIFNIKGQLIETLVNKYNKSGKHSIIWNAGKFCSGIYFYKLKAGDFEKTKKMILLK